MARCLRCDMDEFGMHDVPPPPRHQGNEDVPGCQACRGDIGDFSSPRTPTAPQTAGLMLWGQQKKMKMVDEDGWILEVSAENGTK